MAGVSIQKFRGVGLAVLGRIFKRKGLQLDSYPPLPLQVHLVEDLVHHLPLAHRVCLLQRRSVRLDLPWSIWAMMHQFRMRS